MELWLQFLQDKWYLLLLALVVIVIVIRIVKSVVRWIVTLVVIAGLFLYGQSYKDQLLLVGTTMSADVATQLMKVAAEEVKDAKYKQNADGTFTVTTRSLTLTGTPGSADAKVTFMNQTFTVKLDDVIKAMIEQAKANSAGVK